MLSYEEASIASISIHHVGNRTNGNQLLLSKRPFDLNDSKLQQLLLKFCLDTFGQSEFYQFSFSNDDHNMNPMFRYSQEYFAGGSGFHALSMNLAKHLYEVSDHSQIKDGDLLVVHFDKLTLDAQRVNALGMFKIEHKEPYLLLDGDAGDFSLSYEEGINTDKLDKGCLIFDMLEEDGYRICTADKANRSQEAQYWKDNFLMLKPCKDEYHQTRDFLNITRKFVTDQLPEHFEADKTDQIALLNRSMAYFKENDNFEKEVFEQTVFQDEAVIQSFRQFDKDYRETYDIDLDDSFEISDMAVKKESRVFKSVIKLDKNFHVYIHGNRAMIEKGVESDGRKYYKIFYEQEL